MVAYTVRKSTLEAFPRRHPDARVALALWAQKVESALWQSFSDVRKTFATVSFKEKNTLVFNIKGNHYRLTAEVLYIHNVLVVIKAETLAKYDQQNKRKN